ncbi:MAG: glucosamine-6-phosphate deaminase [Planctomycetota bacterium]|nr:glucosamine-6-phosphate deaminase [Planctomycetota bacterium]
MNALRQRPLIRVFENARTAALAAARRVADVVLERQARRMSAVLGLATGATMVGVYGELVRMHREDGLSFAHVAGFNLDEYWPMDPNDSRSYHKVMAKLLWDQVDVNPSNVHLPDGRVAAAAIDEHCLAYERALRQNGDIDHFLLGIGRTGHIGFNEPGSGAGTRTRLVRLDERTLKDNARLARPGSELPEHAITMGVGTILEARQITLLALGAHKAEIVSRALEGPVHDEVAASFLQAHDNVTVLLDKEAASALSPDLQG